MPVLQVLWSLTSCIPIHSKSPAIVTIADCGLTSTLTELPIDPGPPETPCIYLPATPCISPQMFSEIPTANTTASANMVSTTCNTSKKSVINVSPDCVYSLHRERIRRYSTAWIGILEDYRPVLDKSSLPKIPYPRSTGPTCPDNSLSVLTSYYKAEPPFMSKSFADVVSVSYCSGEEPTPDYMDKKCATPLASVMSNALSTVCGSEGPLKPSPIILTPLDKWDNKYCQNNKYMTTVYPILNCLLQPLKNPLVLY